MGLQFFFTKKYCPRSCLDWYRESPALFVYQLPPSFSPCRWSVCQRFPKLACFFPMVHMLHWSVSCLPVCDIFIYLPLFLNLFSILVFISTIQSGHFTEVYNCSLFHTFFKCIPMWKVSNLKTRSLWCDNIWIFPSELGY